jgi:tetratricopeptide (TPR) repeat protein
LTSRRVHVTVEEYMDLDLHQAISKAEEEAGSGHIDEALSIANGLVLQHPGEIRSWSLRAHLQALKGEVDAAVSDLSNAIIINPAEPALFFDRGRQRMRRADVAGAVEDFSKALELCDFHNNDYYRETLLFMRAEALAMLGRTREALADLGHVRDDFRIYTTKLRSKDDIVAQCVDKDSGSGSFDYTA